MRNMLTSHVFFYLSVTLLILPIVEWNDLTVATKNATIETSEKQLIKIILVFSFSRLSVSHGSVAVTGAEIKSSCQVQIPAELVAFIFLPIILGKCIN